MCLILLVSLVICVRKGICDPNRGNHSRTRSQKIRKNLIYIQKYQYMIVCMNINKADFFNQVYLQPCTMHLLYVCCLSHLMFLFVEPRAAWPQYGAQGSLATIWSPGQHSCPGRLDRDQLKKSRPGFLFTDRQHRFPEKAIS